MKIFGINIPKEVYMTVIIIVVSIFLEKVLKAIVKKALSPKKNVKNIDIKRLETLKSLLCNIVRYVIWILALLSLLSLYGVNTSALVAGVGALSLVVGLAFQDILKDVLAGASILFENQFRVGDLVKIGDFTGTVISLGLKTTRLQSFRSNEIKIISNRNITEVINYSLDNMLSVVDMQVSYESDIDKAEKVLSVCSASLPEKIEELVDEPTVIGVQELADSSVVIRVIAKCKPASQYIVERALRKHLKKALDKAGIKIPYPQVEVHHEK